MLRVLRKLLSATTPNMAPPWQTTQGILHDIYKHEPIVVGMVPFNSQNATRATKILQLMIKQAVEKLFAACSIIRRSDSPKVRGETTPKRTQTTEIR